MPLSVRMGEGAHWCTSRRRQFLVVCRGWVRLLRTSWSLRCSQRFTGQEGESATAVCEQHVSFESAGAPPFVSPLLPPSQGRDRRAYDSCFGKEKPFVLVALLGRGGFFRVVL